ncbi:MAG: hypothetical protein FD153_2075, partial [Rhodospirillaceae bacterium]
MPGRVILKTGSGRNRTFFVAELYRVKEVS